MNKLRIIFFFGIYLSLFPTTLGQNESDPCKLILQNGLYRIYTFSKTGNFTQDIKSYLSSDQFRQDIRNGKWQGDVAAVVDAVPIKLGVGASNEDVTTFQSKVRAANSFSLSQSFYDYAYTSVPDVELAKVYADCVTNTRKVGFTVYPTINERDVLFVVNYKKANSNDPYPKITLFNVKNGTNVTKSFNVGDTLQMDNISVSSDRDPEKDLTLVLETDKGTALYRVPAEPGGFNKDIPVGTIIVSYLNWTEFQLITQNNANNPSGPFWSSRFSKWAPADGRPVPSSRFATAASQLNVPDLRGLFVRGLNSFDPADEPAPVAAKQKDPDPRGRGSFQEDAFRNHDHGGGKHSHNTGRFQGAVTDFNGPVFRTKEDAQPWPTTESEKVIKSEGADETRPKNVSLFHYIRIN
jgi:hypothetical protein